MAPSLRSRRLTCFYCGRRSPLHQDGSVTEWQCGNCEAVNYLDENGEITDPPAAVVEKVGPAVQYAHVSAFDNSQSSLNSDTSLFCNDCLKNQHLVRTSLAQYVPREKETLAVDREYLKFKESLEKRYPQVCEDCFQGVADRLKQSSYTAKTDHLRRLLDKTRKKGAMRKTKPTWLDLFQFLGQLLWTFGIYGQLAWNILGVSGVLRQRIFDLWSVDFSSEDLPISSELDGPNTLLLSIVSWMRNCIGALQSYGTATIFPSDYESIPDLTKWSLVLTLASFWWNPKFKEGVRGYHRHINGFYDWYKYQSILLLIRAIFWAMMGLEAFNRIDAPATLGAHIFMLFFTSMLVRSAQKSIKIDFGPLFTPNSPERLLQYVRPKEKSKYSGHDMSQALTNILGEPSTALSNSPPASQPDPFYENSQSSVIYRHRSSSPYTTPSRQASSGAVALRRSSPRDPRDILGIPRTVPSLSEMTEEESLRYISTGEIPVRMQDQVRNDDAQNDMEWDSQGSQYRAFQPARTPRQSQLFSQAPVAPDSSPFWYKGLPSAPVSQAHKLRNPPNVPRLLPPSKAAKDNFFNSLTGRQSFSEPPETILQETRNADPFVTSRSQEIEFAPPKFFPPTPTGGDLVTGLSDMFEQAFTLKPSEDEIRDVISVPHKTGWERKRRHVLTALVLAAAGLSWNYSFAHPELLPTKIPLGVMALCGVIALVSITDCFLVWSQKNPSLQSSGSALFAAAQTVAGGYTISEIIAGRTDNITCQSHGLILVGAMFIQEVYLAAFA